MFKNRLHFNYATNYAFLGAIFGCCFPVLAIVFMYYSGQNQVAPHLFAIIRHAHHDRLLYIIDTAPFILATLAWFAGLQYDKVLLLANHDALTGLLNHRAFLQKLEYYFQYAKRYDKQAALVFIDLNKFKLINDSYGHNTGDAYLKFVAECLISELRTTDVIGRWGGDEFIVLMPEVGANVAQHVAEKFVSRLCRNVVHLNGHSFTPSASVGLASIASHIQDVSVWIHCADTAMYAAKTKEVCGWAGATSA